MLQLFVFGASVPIMEPNTGAGLIISLVVLRYQSNVAVSRLLKAAESKPMSQVSTFGNQRLS